MSDTFDFTPRLDGAAYDPQPNGGAVSTLRLHSSPDTTAAPVLTVNGSTRISAGVYRFTITPSPAAGRYWTEVEWTPDATSAAIVDTSTRLDLPYDPALAITPEDVAARLGLGPLTPEQREVLYDAVLDAQEHIEGYLGRPIIPLEFTETGLYQPLAGQSWDLENYPVVRIVSTSPDVDAAGQPLGTWRVDYIAGLNAKTDPELGPIRRQVRRVAMNDRAVTRMWQDAAGTAAKRVKNASTDGQSVTWEYLTPTGGQSVDDEPEDKALKRIDRWRLAGRRAFQRKGSASDWPYGSMDTQESRRWPYSPLDAPL